MELLLIIIICLLVFILHRTGERFEKLQNEIRSLRNSVERLTEKQDAPLPQKKEEEKYAPVPIPKERNIPAAPLPVTPPKKTRKKINYEKFIGENLFGKVGILILVVGVGLFVKYAIDRNWINETLRTILGFLAGTALLFFAERICKKYRTFSSLLAGGAFAVYYLTVAIAFHSYQLFSQSVAFIILISITVGMSVLAVLYDRRELAIIALIGGFIAPFLVSNGSDNYIVLFVYVAVLNLGMFGLSLYKRWTGLPLIAFAFTYAIIFAYVLDKLLFSSMSEGMLKHVATHLLGFVTLFYFIFQLPIFFILKEEGKKVYKTLVFATVANNFFYMGLGAFFLSGMALPFKSQGILSLFIAAINLGWTLWLRKSKKEGAFLVYTLIGLVVTFVSLAVPIQLEGSYITLCWASEMVLLLWLYVKSGTKVYEKASVILMVATAFSFFYQLWGAADSTFVTDLFVGIAVGACAFLLGRYRDAFAQNSCLPYKPWNALLIAVSAAIIYYAFMREFHLALDATLSIKVRLLFTSAYLLAMSYGLRKRFPIGKLPVLHAVAIGVNVLIYLWVMPAEADLKMSAAGSLLLWAATLVVVMHLFYVGKTYYATERNSAKFTVYLNIVATLFWLGVIHLFLCQLQLPDEFNAGFSIGLAIAGLVQMLLGMRLHQKVVRIVSLFTFGVALAKLVLVDLWAMPTVGKIITFIVLGIVLLVLSFLYQKLKDVLFKNKC